METPKFCKDCKWCENNLVSRISSIGMGRPYVFAKCKYPYNKDLDREYLVSGSEEVMFCSTRRIYECGPRAEFWEPK